MPTTAEAAWPDRPKRFYDDWEVFAAEAISEIVARGGASGDLVATALLAAGAILGSAAVVRVVEVNQPAIDEKGKEWGIPFLSSLVLGGGVLLGAAAGGLGGAWASRLLGTRTSDDKVRAFEHRLARARRQFEELRQDREAGRLSEPRHMAAVEALFHELVEQAAPG